MTKAPVKRRRPAPKAVKTPAHWRLGIGIFTARPKLLVSMAVGVAVGVGCALASDLAAASCWVAGWDAFCATFMGLVLRALGGKGPAEIRDRAAQEDEGQAVILLLVVTACVASLGAVAMELTLAMDTQGLEKALHVTAAFVTVTASWLLMQMVYALHYAHAYYSANPETGQDWGGLAFLDADKAQPDYWDFLHFAVVIGVAAQTADVAFTDKRLRRLGTGHSLIAFTFNTLIVALTINLVAGLFPHKAG